MHAKKKKFFLFFSSLRSVSIRLIRPIGLQPAKFILEVKQLCGCCQDVVCQNGPEITCFSAFKMSSDELQMTWSGTGFYGKAIHTIDLDGNPSLVCLMDTSDLQQFQCNLSLSGTKTVLRSASFEWASSVVKLPTVKCRQKLTLIRLSPHIA